MHHTAAVWRRTHCYKVFPGPLFAARINRLTFRKPPRNVMPAAVLPSSVDKFVGRLHAYKVHHLHKFTFILVAKQRVQKSYSVQLLLWVYTCMATWAHLQKLLMSENVFWTLLRDKPSSAWLGEDRVLAM